LQQIPTGGEGWTTDDRDNFREGVSRRTRLHRSDPAFGLGRLTEDDL